MPFQFNWKRINKLHTNAKKKKKKMKKKQKCNFCYKHKKHTSPINFGKLILFHIYYT